MKIDLRGTWTMNSVGLDDAINVPAQIPGDTHSALLAANKIPDPYWAQNEMDVQWVGKTDWNFSRSFSVDKDLFAHEAVYLVAEQIDTIAAIYVNGTLAGKSESMFVRFRADVKPLLKIGENTLEIRIRSAAVVNQELADKRHEMLGEVLPSRREHINYSPYGNHTRKTFCHSGWDWGICLMVAGIYDAIYLQGVNTARIEYVHTDQHHEDGKCSLSIHTEILSPNGGKSKLSVNVGTESKTEAITLQKGINLITTELVIKNPDLWFPAGYGEQPLYDLIIKTDDDEHTKKIGLRKLEVIHEKDEIGKSLIFRVNGIDIFCKGADWIPADAMPQRQTKEVFDDLIRSAKEANMNMLRVWGGGQYERDEFYQACDREGILVWQDFMFACSEYPGWDRSFLALVKLEAEHQVKRLKDYACIAIWCGDNEILGIHLHNENKQELTRKLLHLDRINFGILEPAVLAIDPNRMFWYSSPCAGPNDYHNTFKEDHSGDMHFWNVWHGTGAFENYYDVIPRFCSEFGYQSLPSMETIATYAPKEQWNITAPVFDHHQRNNSGNTKITQMFTRYFRIPEGFESFVYLTQVQQALAIKTGVEYWRTQRPVCMGALYWQLNDNWPVCSWSSLDYGGKWKLLHHAARRFYAPLMATAYRKDPEVVEIWGVNDTLADETVTVDLAVYDFNGNILKTEAINTILPAQSSTEIKKEVRTAFCPTPEKGFLIVTLRSSQGTFENVLFLEHPQRCELSKADVDLTITENKNGLSVTLTTDKPVFYLSVDTCGVCGEFDDNMITLLPGAPRTLRWNAKQPITKEQLEKAITLRHLRQTYS